MPNENLSSLTQKLDKSLIKNTIMESKSLQTGESIRNTLVDDDKVSLTKILNWY